MYNIRLFLILLQNNVKRTTNDVFHFTNILIRKEKNKNKIESYDYEPINYPPL